MRHNPKTIIHSAEIPSIPNVLQQILSMADNPRTSSADLEHEVTQEPALVAQILKWVNSASYALPQRVSSVSHAMIILGFGTVKSIASGLILINTFDDLTGLTKEYVNQVWKHTLTSAAIVKVLSKKESPKKRDDLFLAAMIHDVGYLVLKQFFQADYDALLKLDAYPKVEIEMSKFGVEHAQIGAELLSDWKFPEPVTEIVRYHHNLKDYSGDKRDLYYILLADAVAELKSMDEVFVSDPKKMPQKYVDLLDKLGLTPEYLLKEKESIQESVQMVNKLFK